MNGIIGEICHMIGQQFEGFSMKMFLFMIVVGTLVIYGIILLYEKKSGKKIDRLKKIAYLGLMIYMSFLFQITYYRREPGSRLGVVTSLQDISVYLRDSEQMMYQILNVLLFAPYGIFFTMILRQIRGWRRILIIISFSYLCSLAIEMTQLLTHRGYFEVADLLMNVLGGLVGCFIAGVLLKKHE